MALPPQFLNRPDEDEKKKDKKKGKKKRGKKRRYDPKQKKKGRGRYVPKKGERQLPPWMQDKDAV